MRNKSKNKLKTFLTWTACCAFLLFFFIYGAWYLSSLIGLSTSASVDSSAAVEKSSIEAIKSLPYVTWTPTNLEDIKKVGVTKYDRELSSEGVNLFCSENLAGGYFLNMSGEIIRFFPDKRQTKAAWKLMEPYQDDSFLVLIANTAIMKIDHHSNIKWIKEMPFHHDIAVAYNGDMYTITNKKANFPMFSSTEPILDNCLTILTKNGEVKKEISFATMISHDKSLFNITKGQKDKEYFFGKDAWDIFHTNTIEIIDRDIFAGDRKLFEKGNILFCMRQIDIIGVIDVEKERIAWSWGTDELQAPHHPSLLENGNILIFDNGVDRRYSRVIELNPVTEEIDWEYSAKPPGSFYSPTRGAAQRLPNGNTLITESDKGHVFEVTEDGTIVWEFFSPQIDRVKSQRANIYRMMRMPIRDYKLKRTGIGIPLYIK